MTDRKRELEREREKERERESVEILQKIPVLLKFNLVNKILFSSTSKSPPIELF